MTRLYVFTPLIQAILKCSSLAADQLYSQRDGGPYAVELGEDIRGLRELESLLMKFSAKDWHKAKILAMTLAKLKRHLH